MVSSPSTSAPIRPEHKARWEQLTKVGKIRILHARICRWGAFSRPAVVELFTTPAIDLGVLEGHRCYSGGLALLASSDKEEVASSEHRRTRESSRPDHNVELPAATVGPDETVFIDVLHAGEGKIHVLTVQALEIV